MRRPLRLIAALSIACAAALAGESAFTVYAAASLTDAVGEALAEHAKAGGAQGTGNYAAASALAKQIENGAPAHLFISADQRWADHLAGKKLIDPATRADIAANSLVLIAPKDKPFSATLAAGQDLSKAFAGKWTTGDPASVPVGTYAKEALTRLGMWAALEPRLVAAADVRAALRLVELGEVDTGIVYATDAKRSAKVAVVATFPTDSHKPITYPAAIVGQGNDAARAFLAWLRGAAGQAILAKHGFAPSAAGK